MRSIILTLAAVGLIATCGCSALNSTTQPVAINASIPEVNIFINGNFSGKTPVSTRLTRNRDIVIMAQKEGYIPVSKTVGNHLNEYGVIDIVGCVFCLFPGVGLLTPGAWSLDETTIMFHLVPETDPYWQNGTRDNEPITIPPSDTNAPLSSSSQETDTKPSIESVNE